MSAHPQKENAPAVEPLDFHNWKVSQGSDYLCNHNSSALAEAYATYRVEFERARFQDKIEALEIKLAGCHVAATGWSKGGQVARQGDPGWSPSYEDVMELRQKYERLQTLIEAADRLADMCKTEKIHHYWRSEISEAARAYLAASTKVRG